MGLFSSKKKTYVSSVAYPLGEDEGDGKTDYLKYTVLNATLQNRPIGESITQGYLRGQGMSLRNAYGYARDHYAHSVPHSATRYMDSPDRTKLTAILVKKHPGAEIDYLAVVIGTGDFEWWAEQHLTEKFGYDRTTQRFDRPPTGIQEDASVAYDLEPNGQVRILLMNRTGGQAKVVDFRPADYVRMADYVHCCYQAVQHFTSKITTTTRPSTPGETDSTSISVEEIVRTGETQTTTTLGHTTIAGGVATTRITKSVEVRTRPQYLLYRLGAGTYPTMDAWLRTTQLTSPYYPSVPLRIDNKDMTSEDKRNTPLYKTSKKLLDRVGIDIEEIGDNLNESESIDDIDYAFIVFGVSLDTKAQEGKRYLYKYFEHLRDVTSVGTTKSTYDDWRENHTNTQVQLMSLRGGPGFGIQSTPHVTTGQPPAINKLEIYSARNRSENYDIKLQWDYIDTTIHAGQVFPGAKIGDVEITMSGNRRQYEFLKLDLVLDSSQLYARRQLSENTYEEMEISGLYFENFIYQGKSVSISAFDAFHDEEEEGFILPLNNQILRQMSLRDVTDLAYHCTHLVLNCYQIVKQRWYQRGFFKVILVIVAVVIIVATWGTGTPAVVTAMSAAFATAGVTILLAKILAAAIYVLGMMVLMNILTKVAVEVFGEKWGPLIAMVAMIAVGRMDFMGGTVPSTGGVITANQVIGVSNAVLSSVGHLQNYKAGQVMEDITKLQEEWKEKFEELETKMEELLGTNTDLLDIQGMTDATYQMHFEPMDQFLSRTLITGGDVCDITLGQVSDFAALGLQLPVHG